MRKQTTAAVDLGAAFEAVAAALPRSLGFSAEQLPSTTPETLRVRVHGPTTVVHCTGHLDCSVDLGKAKVAKWLQALVDDCTIWAREGRL